ncbi:CCA tRNA nucleotidyltransferase [Paenibacillus sp. RC67]|uniref:CCA tRNA nucleotidyltransferase n=1 Tax=Paenibacillus sp. RC67 TaxID=3039392 RepID=UPI0024AE678B|nr:CCA tRNA nucleotidyltransferase [Paenibacillus sp. RC67]
MKDSLEQGALKIIDTLLKHGYEAYMVGGCVRDKLLNRPVKDYDIATSALPERVERLFARTIPTGLQHGTVTVVIEGQPYEVTTFRKEDVYEDHRRPTEVQYIDSLNEDLRRRDFTMNAMAIDYEGNLLDPFHGTEDIRNGILRCVGEASERFQEDALRMLRCIRFAAEYRLVVEDQTWNALCEHAPLLKHIAMERVRMEMERMMAGASPNRAIELLSSSNVLQNSKVPLLIANMKRMTTLCDTSQLIHPLERWSYLYLVLGIEAVAVEEELRLMTFSKQQIDAVRLPIAAAAYLGSHLHDVSELNVREVERQWKLAAIQYGKESLQALVHILSLDGSGAQHAGVMVQVSSLCVNEGLRWLQEMPVDKLVGLHISGGDLIARIGAPAGPWVAKVLQQMLRETALGVIPNEKEVLLEKAEHYYKEHYSAGM